MNKTITRRDFLGGMIFGISLIAGGCSKRLIWPVFGSDKGSLRLAFYTDVHARKEWKTPTAMARAANSINTKKADLIITGGDLITDGFQYPAAKVAHRWDIYMKMHNSIKGDIFPVIGNHDLVAANPQDGSPPAENPRAIYLDKMGLKGTYYSFDAVGYHFVILDSIKVTGNEYEYNGMIRPGELEWLKQDLSGVRRGTPIVIATHIPLLTSFYAATLGATAAAQKNQVIVNNLEVFKIIEDHNVILVLQGHLHVKEMIRWRGITFITGGAICGRWWRGERHGTKEGYNIITLTGNHIEWEYIEYGWKALRPEDE